jgi:hypothetical protein
VKLKLPVVKLPFTNDSRVCGKCRACCVVMGVSELHKPFCVPCPHLSAEPCSANCTIYETRPGSCGHFECLWLAGLLSRNSRPDTSGIMFIFTSDHMCLNAFEVRAGTIVSNGKVTREFAVAMRQLEKLRPKRIIIWPHGVRPGVNYEIDPAFPGESYLTQPELRCDPEEYCCVADESNGRHPEKILDKQDDRP